MDMGGIRWIIKLGKRTNPPMLELQADGIPISDPAKRYAYWAEQGTAAKWAAAWTLVEYRLRQHGREGELRLQREVAHLRRRSAEVAES